MGLQDFFGFVQIQIGMKQKDLRAIFQEQLLRSVL